MKYNINLILLRLCLIVSIFINMKSANASHAVGADLTYKCIDPIARIYEVTLTFYRDCSGIGAPPAVEIHYDAPSKNFSGNFKYTNQNSGTGNEVSPVCASASTTCSGGSNPGIQEYIYTSLITLPFNASDWTFWYEVGNRNAAINTISSPSGERMYVEAQLNNLTYPENNSPTFTNKPVPFICLGQNFCFNHGARDADGDSLAYSLITPLTTKGVTVNYLFGYSAISPLKTNTQMSFDAETGSFCVTPSKVEITIMAVKVDEFRNGQKIGSVIRDMQVIVRSCSNELPNIDGINGTNIYVDTICAYQPYCFDINSIDLDISQDVSLTWNMGINDATFSPGSGSRPVGKFCWTPDVDDVQTLPHYFTVTVKDNNCTYNGLQTFAFKIFVQQLVIDAGNDQLINCGDKANLSVSYSGSSNATYTWNNGMSGKNITVSDPGTYLVTVNDNGCSGKDSLVVDVLNPPTISLSPKTGEILCNIKKTITASVTPTNATVNWSTGETGNSIQVGSPNWYYATVTKNGCSAKDSVQITKAKFNWDVKLAHSYGCTGDSTYFNSEKTTTSTGSTFSSVWSIGVESYSKDSINHLFKIPGSIPVNAKLTSIEGCVFDTTFNIDVFNRPQAQFLLDSGCIFEQLKFSNKTNGNISKYIWNYGDGTGSLNNPIAYHSYSNSGVFPVTLLVQAQNGCIDSIRQNILVNPKPIVNFSIINTCANDSLNLKANLINNNYSYLWDDTKGSLLQGSDVNTIFKTGGIRNIKLIVEDQLGCKDSITKPVNILNQPNVDISGLEICENTLTKFTTNTSGISTVKWNFGDGTSSTLSDVNKKFNKEGQYLIKLTLTGNNGCSSNDTASVIVQPLPKATLSPLVFCQEKEIELKSLLKYTNKLNTYTWIAGNNIYNDLDAKHSFNNPGSIPVYTTETTPFGCIKYDTTNVLVNPIPVADFTADTLIGCDPINVTFTDKSQTTVKGIKQWKWTIGDKEVGMSSVINSMFNYAGIFDVSLTVTDSNNCEASKTKTDYIEIMASPIANFYFSKNPINEVENLTYINNNSMNATQYDWIYGNNKTSNLSEFEITFDTVGFYPVKLITSNSIGCTDTLIKNLSLVPKFNFWFPTGFSPNNDGSNDYFSSQGLNYDNIEIWVYDRWGVIAYHHSGQSFSWNGQYKNKGKDCQTDVYVYVAVITGWDSKENKFTGTVTLIR